MARFDPVHFLELAERLADGSDEAAWRTAMSRAYYATYLALREPIALSLGGLDPESLRHNAYVDARGKRTEGIIDNLVHTFPHVGHKLQPWMDSLHEHRIAADYKLENPAKSRQDSSSSIPLSAVRAKEMAQNARRLLAAADLLD